MPHKIVAIQTNPIESLNYATDTSILLAEEFAARGFKLFFYTPQNLYFTDGVLKASGCFVSFKETKESFYVASDRTIIDFKSVAVLMVRQNPPFDESYLTNTYLLEHLPKSCFVFNSPKAIRDFPEKLSVLNFPDFMPKTVIAGDLENMLEFYLTHKAIVIKPIHGFGGIDVALIDSRKLFDELAPKYLTKFGHCIMQEYFPSIKTQGDKRILIAGGKVVGAIARYPQEGSILSNLVAGGSASATVLTERENYISNKVAKHLKRHGVFMAGIDLINQYLIEINVTSPTGFKSFNKVTGESVQKDVVDMILKECKGAHETY